MYLLPLLLCFFIATSWGQVQPVAVFPFDQNFDGVTAGGPLAGTPEGKPELAPGKIGQALKSGPSYGWLTYPAAGVLKREAGTVEMWVRANDWSSDDGLFHVFFETRQHGALYLYKYWTSTNLLMLTCPEVEGPYSSAQFATSFKPGEWHHLAGTWSRTGVQVYVDGKPAGKYPVTGELPRELGATFILGDQPWQFPRTTSSLIDEVRIYDRELTPAQIAAHCAGDFGFKVPLDADHALLTYEIDPLAYTVAAHFDAVGADVADARLSVAVGLLGKGQPLPADTPALPANAGQVAASAAFPKRDPGTYDLVGRVLIDGKEAFEMRRDVVIPTAEWLGNQLGMEDKVLPPWTPLQARGTALRCWGREIDLGQNLLPVTIVTAGSQVLSRPLQLSLSAGGKPIAWTSQEARLESSSATRARLRSSATASLGADTVTFLASTVAEYDGLVLCTITTANPEKLALDGLTLEIPVKAEHAVYRHRYGKTWIPTSGNVPPGQGVVDTTDWVPFAWLGDNDRGLFVFTESDAAWVNGKAENAIEIARQGAEVVLRLNLLAPGQRLPPDWTLVVGLQATPVKPLPADRRTWRMTGALGSELAATRRNIDIVWPKPNRPDSLAAFGWPEANDPTAFAAYIRSLHDGGLMAVPYLCLTYVTENTPEWRFYKKLWSMGSADPSIPDAGWDHTFAMVSPNGKGYADFIIWRTKEFLERYGIDGVYHDQTHPYMAAAPDAGVGYVRNGQLCQGTPILGYRALYRRNYAVVKGLPRPTFTQAHMSGKMTVPVLAYDDSYLDGEHFRGVVKDSYLDVLTLDSFRCEYMGRQWGLVPFFLPEFDTENAAKVEPTRGLLGLLLLHDVNIWPIWCHRAVVGEAFQALDAFGYADAEFIPYFDPAPPAGTDLKDVYASAYRKPDGKVLLVVANLGREERSGQLRVDLGRCGTPGAQALNWPEQTPLASAADGVLDLRIPGLAYRLVLLRK